jgi:hypothetical protein
VFALGRAGAQGAESAVPTCRHWFVAPINER